MLPLLVHEHVLMQHNEDMGKGGKEKSLFPEKNTMLSSNSRSEGKSKKETEGKKSEEKN